MLLSYFVGQKYYPIRYPLKEMAAYVALGALLFAAMTLSNRYFPPLAAMAVNTLLGILFVAYIVKKDFPLSGLLIIGKHFRK